MGETMPQTENILNSLRYLKKEAESCENTQLGDVIDVAVSMAEMVVNLRYLQDNNGDDQDIARVMTFIKFYRSAPPHIQRQVYALIAAREEGARSA